VKSVEDNTLSQQTVYHTEYACYVGPIILATRSVIICVREYEPVNDNVLARKKIIFHVKIIMFPTQVFHDLWPAP
jgi:hypothetical protein